MLKVKMKGVDDVYKWHNRSTACEFASSDLEIHLVVVVLTDRTFLIVVSGELIYIYRFRH